MFFAFWIIQETDLKDLAQTADVPKGLQYRARIHRTLGSAGHQIVTVQLLDRIFLKGDGPGGGLRSVKHVRTR